jgi:hypothetical protein
VRCLMNEEGLKPSLQEMEGLKPSLRVGYA